MAPSSGASQSSMPDDDVPSPYRGNTRRTEAARKIFAACQQWPNDIFHENIPGSWSIGLIEGLQILVRDITDPGHESSFASVNDMAAFILGEISRRNPTADPSRAAIKVSDIAAAREKSLIPNNAERETIVATTNEQAAEPPVTPAHRANMASTGASTGTQTNRKGSKVAETPKTTTGDCTGTQTNRKGSKVAETPKTTTGDERCSDDEILSEAPMIASLPIRRTRKRACDEDEDHDFDDLVRKAKRAHIRDQVTSFGQLVHAEKTEWQQRLATASIESNAARLDLKKFEEEGKKLQAEYSAA